MDNSSTPSQVSPGARRLGTLLVILLTLGAGACSADDARGGRDAGSNSGDVTADTSTSERDAADTGDAADATDVRDADDPADTADTAAADAAELDAGADTEPVADAVGDAADIVEPADDWLSGVGWTNVAFTEVAGTVTIEYDVRAMQAGIDGVSGITLGRASAYTDLAMIVRLNQSGTIDVRDGSAYAADLSLPYTPGVTYHVTIQADLDNHTYDVTVAEAGGAATLVRAGAAFRTERVVGRVDHLAFMEPADQLEVGNLRVDGQAVPMEVEPQPTPSGGLWHLDFSGSPPGTYSEAQIGTDWGSVLWASPDGRAEIVEDTGERFLRVHYPAGGVGPGQGGAQWRVDLAGVLGQSYDELYVAYRVRFGSGFDFVLGGKLPGLLGGEGNTGGNTPDGTDGWSGRMMWRSQGRAVQYLYHPDQPGTYGEDLAWDLGSERRFAPGEWVTVEHRIVMNTPGLNDGIVQGWWDGELALDRRDIRFRDVSSFAIDGFYFSTFFGGSGTEWAPTRDEIIDYDDFVYSDRPITH